MEFEDKTELLQYHDKTLLDEGLLLMGMQRKWFLEMGASVFEDAIRIVGMTMKGLEYYTNVANRAIIEFEKIDSNFERRSMNKMLSKSIACYRAIVCERTTQLMWQISLSYFKKLQQPTQPSSTTTLINQWPSTSREHHPSAKRL